MMDAESMNIEDDVTMEYEDVEAKIKDAYSKLNKIQEKDKEHRIQYLLDMADHYAATNNVSRHIAIRELLTHEELRDIFQKIGNN